jgi:pimeloyl-ACP methyl ester carboxylesterase
VVGFAIPSRELFAYRVDIHPKGLLIFPRTLIELGMPIGVREQEVTLANQGAKLVGTFAAPSSASTKMPAFLLIPDVGSYDRDGNRVGLEARTLRDIARRFAQQGVASYRFDSRGVGASEGDYASVSLASLESDALIALVWLRANPMIDPDKIYIVGYGYGGIVALHLGASGMAHGVATLAMPATSFSASQTTALRARAVVKGVGEEEVDTLANHERSFFDYIRGTTGTWADVILSQVRASLPWMDEVEYARQTSEIPLPLLRDLARLDPLDAVRAAKCRLFILNGTKDFDVPASDASVLAQAATDAGNSDVTTAVVGDVNHLLRRHPEDAAALDRHLDAEVDWNVLQPLLNWLGGPVMPGGGTGGPAPIS